MHLAVEEQEQILITHKGYGTPTYGEDSHLMHI